MKVREFIEMLEKFDPDLEVIMSKDGEGNSFSPLADLNFGEYSPSSTCDGEFTTYSDEEYEIDITEEESNSICLWPTN